MWDHDLRQSGNVLGLRPFHITETRDAGFPQQALTLPSAARCTDGPTPSSVAILIADVRCPAAASAGSSG